jgi:hypothetical protein
MEEGQDDADCGDLELSPLVALVEPTSTTSANRPYIIYSTTWGST